MNITSSVSDDGLTITLNISGQFNYSMHLDFRAEYLQYPEGEKSFIVNLSSVDSMDSSAMGMLLQLREHRNKQAGDIKLVGLNDSVRCTLEIANFQKIFKFD